MQSMKFSDQSAKHLSKCLTSPRRPTEAAGCCEGSAARPRLEAGTPGTCALALRALLACKQLVHGECPSTAAQLDLLPLCFPSGSQPPCSALEPALPVSYLRVSLARGL